MASVLNAFGRALRSQLQPRMLWLTLQPFLLGLLVWGAALYVGWQPLVDWLREQAAVNPGVEVAGGVLGWFGFGGLLALLLPLLAFWLLVPIVMLSALLFVTMLAMPAVADYVADQEYPQLAREHGGSLTGSVWTALSSFALFALLWIVTLPLLLIPPLALLLHPALLGWLTYRVMTYDALAAHASAAEYRTILQEHRWPLWSIGIGVALISTAPTLLWLGGALSVLLFPFLVVASIWLYVLLFVFSGIWFQHYCLQALQQQRRDAALDI